jgi:hypothetical protein
MLRWQEIRHPVPPRARPGQAKPNGGREVEAIRGQGQTPGAEVRGRGPNPNRGRDPSPGMSTAIPRDPMRRKFPAIGTPERARNLSRAPAPEPPEG